jgi:hypothetical protein
MVVVLDGGWRVKTESRVSTESMEARQPMHRGQGYLDRDASCNSSLAG